MKDVLNKVLLTSFVRFTRHEKGSSIGTKTGVIAVKGLMILLLVLSLNQCVIRYALNLSKKYYIPKNARSISNVLRNLIN